VSGGSGDDVVDATAVNWPNDPDFASNLLVGGHGDDAMRAFMLTDSNSSVSIGVNEVRGDEGDDELESVHETDGENFRTDLTTMLEGGAGDDHLRAESKAWGENVLTLHELEGGAGDDTLTLSLDLLLFSGSRGNESTTVLDGGPGEDHLAASVTADQAEPCTEDDEPPCSWTPRAQNHLAGGKQNDVLVAALGSDVTGASSLDGGSGNDELTVSGGSGNELDGGTGNDDLFAGDGDEEITGGQGRDTTYFDLSQDQGSDTLVDFDGRQDVLSFAGIEDQGAPGLADDLDAISTITDLGPANDVVIDLAIGTRIIFVGRGTGAVDSWADLVPPQAEATWTPALPVARLATSRTMRSFEAERALLPRDH
jgi:serralysin